MRLPITDKLFPGITLPAWDATALYRLQRRQRRGFEDPSLAAADRDVYARLLMHLIGIRFGKDDWDLSLYKAGLDPQDVAADVLSLLIAKTPAIHIRTADDPSKPERECVLVMLRMLYTAIFRRVATLIGTRSSKVQESNATDVLHRRGRAGQEDRSLDSSIAAPISRFDVGVGVLTRSLAAAEDRVCGSIPGDIHAIVTCFRFARRLIVRGDATRTAYRQLPARLTARVSPEQHALVLSRTFRIAQHAVENINDDTE